MYSPFTKITYMLTYIRNINNLRYADYTTLMAESEEKLKSLLITVKEESENSAFKKLIWHLIRSLYNK